MADQYDVTALSEYADKATGEKKTRYTRVGVAWPMKGKDGFTMNLDASAVSGRYILQPKKEQERGSRGTSSHSDHPSGPAGGTGGDDIPFAKFDMP